MHGTNTARTLDPNLATHAQLTQARAILDHARLVSARTGDDGRPSSRFGFGGCKVFVSALAEEMGIDAQALVEIIRPLIPLHDAEGAPLLVMARADLVAALDPEAVRRSEILDRGASFHFVVDRTRDPQAYGRSRR